MIDQKSITIIIDQANKLFEIAQQELYKPEEDVVHYMVCRNAFKSVNKFLTGFLLDQGVEIHASISLDSLLNQCRKVDATFNDLNLDDMYNSNTNENVWMDMKTAKSFISLAEQTQKIVLTIRNKQLQS